MIFISMQNHTVNIPQASQARDTKRLCYFNMSGRDFGEKSVLCLQCKRPTVTALCKWCYVTMSTVDFECFIKRCTSPKERFRKALFSV